MPEVELAAGIIEYQDTGGDGPVLVFLHGLTMDVSLWRKVVPGLAPDYRCVLPTLPLGGHRRPMRAGADLSLRGVALLVGEFIERIGLTGVTLVQNDWGGAQILIAEGDTTRLARLVISSCEAFGNYPPRPAKAMVAAARVPGGLAAVMRLLRLRAVRRAPGSWGWMSATASGSPACSPTPGSSRSTTATPSFQKISPSIPEDQPERLIRAIRDFVPVTAPGHP
jgi:pimeloyl-ACP methyl ester carboxylesterase